MIFFFVDDIYMTLLKILIVIAGELISKGVEIDKKVA